MNKFLFGILSLILFVSTVQAQDQQNNPVAIVLNAAVTNMAANTTNTVAGAIEQIPTSPRPIRIWVTAQGNSGTTNGGGAGVSNLVVKISTASGTQFSTNSFDTASFSNIKVTCGPLFQATNTFSDFFEVRGARYIRIGQIENNFAGSVSNISVIVGYPK